MGRPIGSRELSVKQIKTIVEMSLDGEERPKIAEAADIGKRTVWRYQNEFDLI